MTLADFFRVAPRFNRDGVDGDNSPLSSIRRVLVGKTDAGRPELPLAQEVSQ